MVKQKILNSLFCVFGCAKIHRRLAVGEGILCENLRFAPRRRIYIRREEANGDRKRLDNDGEIRRISTSKISCKYNQMLYSSFGVFGCAKIHRRLAVGEGILCENLRFAPRRRIYIRREEANGDRKRLNKSRKFAEFQPQKSVVNIIKCFILSSAFSVAPKYTVNGILVARRQAPPPMPRSANQRRST